MSLGTNFNINPYYDDFDETKNYLRLLFKPGQSVQARELTQIQSLLQNQIQRFSSNIFRNGSVVSGAQFFLQSATYLKLNPTYQDIDINVNNFENKTIYNDTNTKRAEVLKTYSYDSGTDEPNTLMVKQNFGEIFQVNDVVMTSEESPSSATITGVGNGLIFSITEGIFYYDGFFVRNAAQTIAISKYQTEVSARIGFEINEYTITSTVDSSLLDPALNASNYQAPGSDRYKIELKLSTRSLDSTDDTRFIELVRIQDGRIIKENKYPIYSVIEDTLARRTYDESGNYTVKQFTISLDDNTSNTAQTDIILSPGKAYVYGYEFETSAPTVLTIDKPRTTEDVSNKRISADYGNFIYTTNHYGAMPINDLSIVDLHCVSSNNINTASIQTIANTKIGTARVKSVSFDTTSNISDSNTYQYRTFLFDISVGSISGNVVNSNATSVQISDSANGYFYSTIDDAYKGAKLRLKYDNGTISTPRSITSFNASTQTITIDNALSATSNANTIFYIDFEFNDIESIFKHSTGTKLLSADVSTRSKDYATVYNDVVLSDSTLESLIFNLGEEYISQNTINDMTFSYKKLYKSQPFGLTDSPSLALINGESLAQGTTNTSKLSNYLIAVTNQGSSSYPVGSIIPADKITINTNTNRIGVANANYMIADIIVTVDVATTNKKNKTLIKSNTETLLITNGVDVFGDATVISHPANGQCAFASDILFQQEVSQSLYVSDVIRINKIVDFDGLDYIPDNYQYAIDITDNFTFDNGQRDSYYDHSSIRLKVGRPSPYGPVVVFYDRFKSTGAGFFTVDSYASVDYSEIPSYISQKTNTTYLLRDCIDYRPVRKDASNGTGNEVLFDVDDSITGPKIPENGSTIMLDYSYYLPRIDKVVLDKTRQFQIIKGTPSLTPIPPEDTKTGMTLYVVNYKPYTSNKNDITVQQIQHKRYTMRDIGAIEKRVENLEYYTSLSLLEQDTLSKQDVTILDSQNLPRFKNGIVVDSFTGHAVSDVINPDYNAAIDPINNELRPAFDISAHRLIFNPATSTNYQQKGSLVTINSTESVMIDQNKASRTINVNPFNVINYLGKIKLFPQSDIWVDTTKKPDLLVNLGGEKDAWEYLANNAFNVSWNSWQTVWSGTESTWSGRTLTTTSTTQQTRSGLQTKVVPETITQSIGDRVLDVSVIPFMRTINILFTGNSFKPSTNLYSFFDNKSVQNYTTIANKIVLANNNIQYNIDYNNPEVVTIRDKDNNSANGRAVVVHSANNILYVTNVVANSEFNFENCQIVGDQTGLAYDVISYHHMSGLSFGATANTITLHPDASANVGVSNTESYIGKTIYITEGTGEGQTVTITSYNPATKVAGVYPNWRVTPQANNSFYSIGQLTSDEFGSVAGVFKIPAGEFRVGEKLFRLIDTPSGDLPSSYTNGDASFFAQGLLQTKQETMVSTIAPNIERTTVTQNNTIKTVSSVTFWSDPVAETFLVSPEQYPSGLYLSKVRFCFKSKDDTIPITLQIRPTVNGYPSSSVIYPFSTVTLTPDKVKTTETPNLDNDSFATDFIFDSPVYLMPGEHSFVLISNSNKYEVYIAEIGALDIVSNRQISEQPYGGSFFMSQNGSTWTPEQNSDMMFRMYRHNYDTAATVDFILDAPNVDLTYSALQLITSEVSPIDTTLRYEYTSKLLNGATAPTSPITPYVNLELVDINGTRVLTTSNTSFKLTGALTTNNSNISPCVDISRIGILRIDNNINNLELSNTDIVISNTGSGYANSDDVLITISGGNGSGATAVANVVDGKIVSVMLTNNGKGYSATPTINITSSTGSGAIVTYNGETEKRGGNATAKYITRRVTLNDGFDSGDLRVYMTVNKPSGTNIHVYYKVLSGSDPELFDDKKWQLMTELGNANYASINKDDYRELVFAPGSNGIPSNSISYTSGETAYSSFKTFSIKVVMSSNVNTIVPKIRDFRAIAFPAG